MFGQADRRLWSGHPGQVLARQRSVAAPALPVHLAFRHLPSPLIVIGMHGSGSSIVSRILIELGV